MVKPESKRKRVIYIERAGVGRLTQFLFKKTKSKSTNRMTWMGDEGGDCKHPNN